MLLCVCVCVSAREHIFLERGKQFYVHAQEELLANMGLSTLNTDPTYANSAELSLGITRRGNRSQSDFLLWLDGILRLWVPQCVRDSMVIVGIVPELFLVPHWSGSNCNTPASVTSNLSVVTHAPTEAVLNKTCPSTLCTTNFYILNEYEYLLIYE